MTIYAGTDLNLTAGTDINIPSDVGLTFGNDGEKIEGDGTDLTIAGNNINLTATADVVVPANVGITFGSGEKIEGDSTDLTITSGAKINLTATSDVVIPANVGITFGSGEKIEGDSTDLTITSGAKINLTATSDVVIPANVGITFGSGEKIEGDSTDLTVTSGADINLTATADVNIPADVGLTFGNDGEKIEGDGTNLAINSSGTTTITSAGNNLSSSTTNGLTGSNSGSGSEVHNNITGTSTSTTSSDTGMKIRVNALYGTAQTALASATSTSGNDLAITTFEGTLQITGTDGIRHNGANAWFYAPTLTEASGANFVAASTVYIEAAPSGATTNYALWVDAGTSRFDGDITSSGDLTLAPAADIIFKQGGNEIGRFEPAYGGYTDAFRVVGITSSYATEVHIQGLSGYDSSVVFYEAGTWKYIWGYDASANLFRLTTTDSNGSGTNATVFSIADGTDDVTFAGQIVAVGGILSNGKVQIDQTELTISSGAVTATRGYHSIDTEGDASSDNLDTISGGVDGMILVLTSVDDGRDVTGTESGNIKAASASGEMVLTNLADTMMLIYSAGDSHWHEISRSNNA